MTSFAYRASRLDGAIERGVVEAPNREQASAALTLRGLFPLQLVAESRRRGAGSLGLSDLALGLRALADLLDSGLPIGRALDGLQEIAPPAWKDLIPRLTAVVRQGRSLDRAFDESGVRIPRAVLGIIRAGDAGGRIAEAVRSAATMVEQAAATRTAITSALAYPAVLAATCSGAIGLLVGVVLPRFSALIADAGSQLPTSTRLLLDLTTAARRASIPAAAAIVVGALIWWRWIISDQGLRQWNELLLRTPILGAIRFSASSAMVSASMAALMEAGVALPVAIEHAAHASGDAAITTRLLASREAVIGGERLSRAIEHARALTPMTIRLIRAGEETGRVTAMLSHASRLERDHAQRTVKNAVRLIEPLMILTFGALVALVAASLLQAIYSVRPV